VITAESVSQLVFDKINMFGLFPESIGDADLMLRNINFLMEIHRASGERLGS
jgi:hypothetical protein